MAATFGSYSTLPVPCAILGQGDTMRRQIANLGNDWTKIGIAFGLRVVGTASLASAGTNESIAVSGAATRFGFGLKNNNGTLIGQTGCKFIGYGSSGVGTSGWLNSQYHQSTGDIRSDQNFSRGRAGIMVDGNEIFSEDAVTLSSDASGGTEETTNFTKIQALTIEVVGRGTAGQQLIFKKNLASAVSAITQAALESAILSATTAFTTVACPHATYDLSDINCVFIQWPFANNRLLVFGPTSGVIGSPYFMRLT